MTQKQPLASAEGVEGWVRISLRELGNEEATGGTVPDTSEAACMN